MQIDISKKMDKLIVTEALRSRRTKEEVTNAAIEEYMKKANPIYISAPVNALVEGLYEEDTLISDIKKRGDFGIGTFNNLDGEMVMLDGKVFQLLANGKVETVDDDVQTPFSCVTFFRADAAEEVSGEHNYQQFNDLLDKCVPSRNMLYSIRIDGLFKYVRTRSVPKQDNYRPLVEVTKEQPEFEYSDIYGTIVGFYSPPFISSVTVPGYHFHFLSDDFHHGGHLLECNMREGKIGIQHHAHMDLGLPITLDFMTADFTRDTEKDLEKAER